MNNTIKLKRNHLAMAVAVGMSLSAHSYGIEEPIIEEVVAVGVRGAQQSAINAKRSADSILDGIAAEDIGKLPDLTIADSLQRISGVQIRRSAGEGGAVNIRGLPQVVTQLNGEHYLGAGSVTAVQPQFGDIPSQLFKGASVHKSSEANLGPSGISGTINLQTRRPFDLGDGLTTAAAAEIQHSKASDGADPVLNGLVNWNGKRAGFLFSASFADVNLANYYNGFNTASPTGAADWVSTSNEGKESIASLTSNEYVDPQGWVAWNQITERQRLGLNAAFQMDLGEGFHVNVDVFHTSQKEYNRKVGLSATNRWQNVDWISPTDYSETDIIQSHEIAEGENGTTTAERPWLTYTKADLDVLRLKSFSQNDSFDNRSNYFNIELLYNRGGDLSGSVRYVRSKATSRRRHGYNEGDLTDWSDTNSFSLQPFYPASECSRFAEQNPQIVGSEGGCFLEPNPHGYSENPQLAIDFSGSHPVWSQWDSPISGGLGNGFTVKDYMANLQSYAIGAFSSENNTDSQGTMDTFRLDGQFSLGAGLFKSLEFGLRLSQRGVSQEMYHLFSPFYADSTYTQEGCLAQWKAIDIELNHELCRAGEFVDGNFQGYTALPPTELSDHNNVIWVDDFGPIESVPGVWAVDPKDYDDPEAFHRKVFGSVVKATVPGSSFNVDMTDFSYYIQANFSRQKWSGNIGLKLVETTLSIKQNQTGDDLPFGNTNVDTGDVLTKRDFSDVLPSLNVSYDLTENVKLRFAASKTMTPLDLDKWGNGLAVNMINSQESAEDIAEGTFIVSSASLSGNPALDPWRATNFDLSLEYYFGLASLLNVGLFQIDVDSFSQSGTVPLELADSDGIIRRTTYASTQVQGDGGSLGGLELALKLAVSDITSVAWLAGVGVDANYTYSPSEQNSYDLQGNKSPFPDNSEEQINLVFWYQKEKFQTRFAYNYRTDRLASTGISSAGLNLYQKPTAYVDISASYDFTDAITMYINGSNITGEYEDYYLEFEDQYAFQNYYEPRYSIGIRARF